ncbi:MAG: hypothetical protein ACRD0K_27640 [Egibacteraceae bacterium]
MAAATWDTHIAAAQRAKRPALHSAASNTRPSSPPRVAVPATKASIAR